MGVYSLLYCLFTITVSLSGQAKEMDAELFDKQSKCLRQVCGNQSYVPYGLRCLVVKQGFRRLIITASQFF